MRAGGWVELCGHHVGMEQDLGLLVFVINVIYSFRAIDACLTEAVLSVLSTNISIG